MLSLAALMVCGCDAGGPETNIPKIPLLHPQASTIPQQNAIRIEWDLNTEEDVTGYRIYRSTSAEEKDFHVIGTIPDREGYYEDTSVSVGIKYYYRVSAFDDGGNESGKSNAVYYTLLEKPILLEPGDQSVVGTTTPTFAWLGVSGASAYRIQVHIRTAGGGAWELIWRSESVYPYQELRKTYNDDNLALKPLENGITYRWHVDSSGGRFAGSQSRWWYFTVIVDR